MHASERGQEEEGGGETGWVAGIDLARAGRAGWCPERQEVTLGCRWTGQEKMDKGCRAGGTAFTPLPSAAQKEKRGGQSRPMPCRSEVGQHVVGRIDECLVAEEILVLGLRARRREGGG